MLLRVFTVSLALVLSTPAPPVSAHQPVAEAPTAALVRPATVPDEPTPPTINDFLPEDRPIGDCISALPKPGCGSESRGGWRQSLVLLAILGGLGFIAWRVVAASRRARATGSAPTATSPGASGGDRRTPDAADVPADPGDGSAP